MKVYFACSITGGREDEAIYQRIVEAMLRDGHEVPTALLADPGVMKLEASHPADEVYARDIAWIEDCHVLVAEISTPSHGVGYEVGYAQHIGKPTLCIYLEGRKVSKMILGNDSPTLQVSAYDNKDEALKITREFLRKHTPN